MIVKRRVATDTNVIRKGDRIKFKLRGSKYTATAVKVDEAGALFVFDQFLDEARLMNKNGSAKGGYEESDMRKYLQELAEEFPDELDDRMLPFENGDRLRLLTLPEVCGYDDNFDKCDGQIPYFKDRRHRIAERKGESYEWMWTSTVVSAADFACVGTYGNADHYGAGYALGVRPAFLISNL